MEFVDNTGHIFSLKSYNEKPIGYEYDETPYIFWLDSNTSKLSVNNFYSRSIYCLYLMNNDYDISSLEDDENSPIEISIEIENSNVFSLISSKKINEHILSENYNDLNDYIDLNSLDNDSSKCISKSLSNKDLCVIKTTETIEKNSGSTDFNYLLIPIYPIACAKEEGTWITNIMIHIYDKVKNVHDWCPISIGGEFINEYEELIINGKNVGVSLPKDILKAVYSESLYNDEFNEALYNEKLKEYLINISSIKHECGNFKSAINSLKWFGYGNKLTISKLLKTDNELKNQYLLDYFDISYDIIDTFKNFVSDSLISIKLMLDKELDDSNPINIHNDMIGESKPQIISLLNKYEKVKIGNHNMPIENDDEKYWYWKPYFDFSFNELGIKLACLKQFYKKYFLPIHLYIHSIGLGTRVYANDIKYTAMTGISMSQPIISLNTKECEVKFEQYNDYYFNKQLHYVDDNFNEFTIQNVDTDNHEWYEINDTCVSIPINFISNNQNNGYFNCVLILFNKHISNKPLFERHFSFYQTDQIKYKNFVIYPKKINIKDNLTSNYFQYWINDDFEIKLLVNNRWYDYSFNLKIHNPSIDFGILRYRYYFNDHNYLLSKIDNDTNIHSLIFTNEELHNKTFNSNLYNMSNVLSVNDNLYEILGLLDENKDSINSYIKTIDLSGNSSDDFFNMPSTKFHKEKLYQYFESNYNILSPFTQLRKIDHDNKRISFNSYMHTSKLIDVNNINYDIDFYKILKYHLDHNLSYIDGTLLRDEFYQYIIYNNKEVLIHKDLIGKDIEIPLEYFTSEKIIVCAWQDQLYILSETSEHSDNYFINTVDYPDNEIYVSENDEYALLFDSINLKYKKSEHAYYELLPNIVNGEIVGYIESNLYYIYDKLYNNTDYIYDNYKYEVNLPNLDKYKNSLHMFDIYRLEQNECNILLFHNDIDLYINHLHFKSNKHEVNNEESNKIYISGKLNLNSTIADTRYPDIYGLHIIDNPIVDNGRILNIPTEVENKLEEYGFYVKRDYEKYFDRSIKNTYDLPDLFEFDTKEFTYYQSSKYVPIGSLYFKTIDDFYSNNFYKEELFDNYSDIKIFKEDDKYCFYDLNIKDLNNFEKTYKNICKFKFGFYNENDEKIENVTINDLNKINYSYIKIILFYANVNIVRNRFYLLKDYITKYVNNENNYSFEYINEDKLLITNNEGLSQTVHLIYLGKKYKYTNNNEYDYFLSNQNPAYYWLNVDNNEIVSLPKYFNELERYIYNAEDESLVDIIKKLDAYKEKFINHNLDDKEEARYQYYNYLSKDLTGKIGKYKLSVKQKLNGNATANIYVEIFEDNKLKTYKTNDIFSLSGNEQKVTLYIQLSINDINETIDTWIIPELYEIKEIEHQLEYDPNKYGNDDPILVKYLNKEYYYGNNLGDDLYDLYNDFFKLKFNIYDVTTENNNVNCNLLNSVYEEVDSIKLNTYLDYDFYLMHDDKHWYGLYISEQTCDKINRHNDLQIPNDQRKLYIKDNDNNIKYILNYKNSSKEYLLNRFEFISNNGLNHFSNDSIICCYVHNNDRLPFNPYVSSKWVISPMSLGMTSESKFESNAEMTIISVPKNDNIYQSGYYKATVKYSLDRDIQHQFKNTTTFKIY